MRKVLKNITGTGLAILANTAFAGPSLPTGGGANFAVFRTWMQNWVDFMAGPFGNAAVITACIIGFATWAILPKEGVVGIVLRVIVAAIVILNVGAWIASAQG